MARKVDFEFWNFSAWNCYFDIGCYSIFILYKEIIEDKKVIYTTDEEHLSQIFNK